MRLGPPPRPTRVVDLLNPTAVLLPAANVIMQLASPAVGYGVLESPVDSGNVYKHPLKRARTTGTYLAAATLGTDADRALIRDEVDRVHALVRSTKSSPVSYNAFDPRLQLWVAACLYRYYIDQHEFLYGPLDDDSADAVYQDAKITVSAMENTHLRFIQPGNPSYARDRSYGLRFQTPSGSVVFTGDSGPSQSLTKLAKGADILVTEVIDVRGTISFATASSPTFLPRALPTSVELR